MFSRKNKGFTLIELLVVIAIIGILASVVLASLNSARKKSRDARRVADIKQLQLAQELYFDSQRQYATTLVALVTGGHIASVPRDPLSPSAGIQCRITDYCFAFHPLAAPTVYHFGANLEEDTNIALQSKKNCNSTIANSCVPATPAFAGGTPFNGTVASIYDVIP